MRVHVSIGGWCSFYNITIMCTYNAYSRCWKCPPSAATHLSSSYEGLDNILKFHSSDGCDFLSYVPFEVVNGLSIFPVHPAFPCSPQIKVTGCQTGASWRLQILTYYYSFTTTKSTTQFHHWHCCCVRNGGILLKITGHAFSIRVLWIYTRSRNENSCLGLSQIAIITITTLTALMSNNNHNQ